MAMLNNQRVYIYIVYIVGLTHPHISKRSDFATNLTERMHHLSSEQCPQWQWQFHLSCPMVFIWGMGSKNGELYPQKATPSLVTLPKITDMSDFPWEKHTGNHGSFTIQVRDRPRVLHPHLDPEGRFGTP